MKSNKTKYIFECTGLDELTEFNEGFNEKLREHCERPEHFKPSLACLENSKEELHGPCRYLKVHKYAGGKKN